jgi:hypothetical protein
MVQFGFSGSSRGLDVMPMSGLVAAIVMFPPLRDLPVDTLADQRCLDLFGLPIQKKRTRRNEEPAEKSQARMARSE